MIRIARLDSSAGALRRAPADRSGPRDSCMCLRRQRGREVDDAARGERAAVRRAGADDRHVRAPGRGSARRRAAGARRRTAVEVVRRKGRKNTLLDADGEVLDPAPLDRALGGLTGEVHAGLFEITHDSLVAGGHELLAGRGAVGESLFAAAAGTSRLHALLRRLEGDADAVFTPLGRKKELNVLLARTPRRCARCATPRCARRSTRRWPGRWRGWRRPTPGRAPSWTRSSTSAHGWSGCAARCRWRRCG